MTKKITKTDAEWRAQLTPEQYRVARQDGTEMAFSGDYYDLKQQGSYQCVCCGAALFISEQKYDSGSGWPSFWQPVDVGNIDEQVDISHADAASWIVVLRNRITCNRRDQDGNKRYRDVGCSSPYRVHHFAFLRWGPHFLQ